MKIFTVIGNRPQFVKAAAVSRLLRERHDELLVHTGQHHDDELSAIFFEELQVPRPEVQLHIAGGTNTDQTARMLAEIGPLLATERPDVVLVYGDTNSTVAGGLAAAQANIRSSTSRRACARSTAEMPEELNRVLTDHLSELLLVSSETAEQNLAREAVAGRVVNVGDVMVDVSMMFQPRAKADLKPLRAAGVVPGEYIIATAHRAGNVDVPERLRKLVDLLLALEEPVVLPLHPRTGAPPGRRRMAGRAAVRRPRAAGAAARLHGLHLAADQRAPRADRFGRRAEGGLLRGRPVRDDARHDRVGSRPSRPAGTSWSTSTCTPR